MPKRKAKPWGSSQPALFGAGARRRVKQAVDRAIRRGQREGLLATELDAGLCAMARTLAEALDEASGAGGDRWLLARLNGELRETLARLRLDPTARPTDNRDDLQELLAALAGDDAG